MDVTNVVKGGESDSVEFKASARWDYHTNAPNKALEAVVTKTVAGFLNSSGGMLLIGVDDEGRIVGLVQDYKTLSKRPNRDGNQQFLINLISASIGKDVCASVAISFHCVGERDVCILRIPRSARAVYLPDGQHTRLFVRTGNTTQELSTKESVQYVSTHWPK